MGCKKCYILSCSKNESLDAALFLLIMCVELKD